MIYTNSNGEKFQSGSGGTYAADNGDPQCDTDDEENDYSGPEPGDWETWEREPI
jgi:hypothetical protein